MQSRLVCLRSSIIYAVGKHLRCDLYVALHDDTVQCQDIVSACAASSQQTKMLCMNFVSCVNHLSNIGR